MKLFREPQNVLLNFQEREQRQFKKPLKNQKE
jgi:hypothetical protein